MACGPVCNQRCVRRVCANTPSCHPQFSLARRAAAADPAALPQPAPLPPPDAMSDADTLLASMTPDQVATARADLAARLPPGAAEFLRRRGEARMVARQKVGDGAVAATVPAVPAPAQPCFPPASLQLPGADAGASAPPSASTTTTPPSPPCLRLRFSLHGDPVGLAPPSAPPSDALQRDPLRTDAAALGYSLPEAAMLARSSLPAQRAAGVELLTAVAVKAVARGQDEVEGVVVGDDTTPTTWADVLASARAHATRPLVAACGDAGSATATSTALRGLVALLAPGGAGADTDALWIAAAAHAPARVARCVASRPHPVAAWVTWRRDDGEEEDSEEVKDVASASFSRDPLAAAFSIAGLAPALARVLAPESSGRSINDCVAALTLVVVAGLAGGVAAAAATAATGARVVDLAGDVDAPVNVRVAALTAAAHLCAASPAHARLLASAGAAGAAVSTALAAAAAPPTDRQLACPSLRLWTALVTHAIPCLRLDDALAGLAPLVFDATAAECDTAAALTLAAAAVASRSDDAISPACAATVATEATWVLEAGVAGVAGDAWAAGNTAPAARLAAALRLLAVAASTTPGAGGLKSRLADALAASGLAAPESDGPGADLVGGALDVVAGTVHGDHHPRAIIAADLLTSILEAARAATPSARPALAVAAWAAMAPAVIAAAAAAAPMQTEWTWEDAAVAQAAVCGVTLLQAATRAAAGDGKQSTFAPPDLPSDPPPMDAYLSAFRLLPPGTDALGLGLLSGAFATSCLEHAAAAADAAVGALASAPAAPLARAARGGGAWDEPGFVDANKLGRDLLAAYAESWCGFAVEEEGGEGGGGGSGDHFSPLQTFLPATGSRLPPPSTFLLADYGGASPRRDGAAAAGAALTLFLGLEKSGSPCCRLPSPADRLPLLLDVVTGVGVEPAEPWRDARARWCLASLLKRGVAPPSTMAPAVASRAASHYAADTYGDLLVGHLVARVFLPGGAAAAATAALDALDDGDALWSLPPVGDIEGVGTVPDDLGARLGRALAGGRLARGVVVGQERGEVSCLVAMALDWACGRCFADNALLRSFVATAPLDELAALLAWRKGEGGGVEARAVASRRAAAGNADALAKVDAAVARIAECG